MTAAVPGDPAGDVAQDVVGAIRGLHPPFETAVTGPAAEFVDQQAAIGSRLLPAVLLLCALTFLVLWLMTGSVVLPVKAIAMNALTVGAALAPLLIIYQGGRFEDLLGYTSNGGVEPTDFLVTAAVVFALSTDYGVFLLGRIKEARDDGETDREAVAVGVARTGGVVTAAAILLAVAIGAFSTSSISFIQQIGIAAATGVLLDAFVVRTLLVPSLMVLLGSWNWWSPTPLRRAARPPRHRRDGGPRVAARREPLTLRTMTGALRNPTLQRWLPVIVLPPILLLDGRAVRGRRPRRRPQRRPRRRRDAAARPADAARVLRDGPAARRRGRPRAVGLRAGHDRRGASPPGRCSSSPAPTAAGRRSSRRWPWRRAC